MPLTRLFPRLLHASYTPRTQVAGTENAATSKPKLAGNFPNAKNVRGRLVWARPPFADMPLWNADAVRGNIVAIMRGPAAPAPGVLLPLLEHVSHMSLNTHCQRLQTRPTASFRACVSYVLKHALTQRLPQPSPTASKCTTHSLLAQKR